MSIFRKTIPVTDYQELSDVAGRIISAKPTRDGRSDVIDIWFENSGGDVKVGVYIFGTGHPTPWTGWTRYAWSFVDTVVTPSGLVWHVYTGPLEGEAVPS